MENESNLIKIIENEVLSYKDVSKFSRQSKTNRSGEYYNPAIKVSEEEGEYIIGIDIYVRYGVNIPQLCYDIQTGLIHNLMKKSGVQVKMVNIKIEGLDK